MHAHAPPTTTERHFSLAPALRWRCAGVRVVRAVKVASAVNGVLGATTGVGLLPLSVSWPALAGSLAEGHPPVDPSGRLLDAALVFGPLALPLLVLATGLALRATWRGERDAGRWNAVALAGWLLVSALGAAVVALA